MSGETSRFAICTAASQATWDNWEPCLLSLFEAGVDSIDMIGLSDEDLPQSLREAAMAGRLTTSAHWLDSVNALAPTVDRFWLVTAPVIVPRDLAQNADRFLDQDPRVAAVAFWSNAAGALSFPHWCGPTQYPSPGVSAEDTTARLRQGASEGAVPICLPWGALHCVSKDVLNALGLTEALGTHASVDMLNFGRRAKERGFRFVLDAQTYVEYSIDLCPWPGSSLVGSPTDALARMSEETQALAALDVTGKREPLNLAFTSARAQVMGLRVLIDASCLGDFEMGTQVQAMALIRGLAGHPHVAYLGVGVPNAELPSYASELLQLPGVHVKHAPGLDFSAFPPVDVIHVPFQPGRLPWQQWTDRAHRLVVTIQDLIAFDNSRYHGSFSEWLEYRGNIEAAVERSDLVVAISPDVRNAVKSAGLDVPAERITVVAQGADHLSGTETIAQPDALRRAGVSGKPFLLVLGASYAHKNRALAMAAWQLLRAVGYSHDLVLAGVTVGRGSDRLGEARGRAHAANGLHLLPDVTTSERNWLLKHADLVLYPTSAEGFGLVPYEAAAFGTPTVFVRFGPLQDNFTEGPGQSENWSPEALVAAIREVLDDPAVGRRLVSNVLGHSVSLTWERTADALVQEYLRILALPSRSKAARNWYQEAQKRE